MRKTNRKQTRVKGTEDRRVVEFFVKHGQFLLPMIDLIEESSQTIDDLIDVVGRGAVEAVLQLSAQQLTGAKSQGRKVVRENGVRWHGRQEFLQLALAITILGYVLVAFLRRWFGNSTATTKRTY